MKTTLFLATTLATTFSFAGEATINGKVVELTAPITLEATSTVCNSLQCMLNASNVSYVSHDFKTVWTMNGIDAAKVCSFANALGIAGDTNVSIIGESQMDSCTLVQGK